MKSSLRINKNGTIRATGMLADELFKSMTATKAERLERATPRPWHLVLNIARIRAGTIERFVADCKIGGNGEANAALIVKAVNEYDALCSSAELSERMAATLMNLFNAYRGDGRDSAVIQQEARNILSEYQTVSANLAAIRGK